MIYHLNYLVWNDNIVGNNILVFVDISLFSEISVDKKLLTSKVKKVMTC